MKKKHCSRTNFSTVKNVLFFLVCCMVLSITSIWYRQNFGLDLRNTICGIFVTDKWINSKGRNAFSIRNSYLDSAPEDRCVPVLGSEFKQ